ncbi:hypothetical protein OG946_26130 [Streptomyces sp. NBC_01808]|uniref:hypothetical protein n=1 Tax=Streptomyces sp. NBC_01808 TaxID=2975947 RepID=UPI002DDA72F3|nr:hypothetical protein [Streptomyces sp. NBC_01808]WSA40543.1 hypothetical protein OG946_26130 [Streptomyces sp. NBC_01808]
MTDHHDTALRPSTLVWVRGHLAAGERIVRTEALHGGISAEVRRLTIATAGGGTRDLVLRTFADRERAPEWLVRDALSFSEEVEVVSRPWREAGRTELTTRAVEGRLDAYVVALMGALG